MSRKHRTSFKHTSTHHNTDWRKTHKAFIQQNLSKKERDFVRNGRYSQLLEWLNNKELHCLGQGATKDGFDLSCQGMPNLAVKRLAEYPDAVFGNQLDSEIKQYKQIIAEGDERFFIPFFRAWVGKKGSKGDSMVLCYRAEVVDALSDLIDDYCVEQEQEYRNIIKKYEIKDVWTHEGNSCLVAGSVRILDFGIAG